MSAPPTSSVLPARSPAPSRPVARSAVVYVLAFTAVAAWLPYLPVHYAEIGLPLGTVGALVALFAGVSVVSAPVWGVASDRSRSTRLPLVLASLTAGVGAAMLALAREPVAAGVSVAVMGLGAGGMLPLLDSRTLEVLGERRDRYGQARAWGSVAFVVATVGIGTLIAALGTSGLFLALVPACLLAGVAAWALLGGGREDGGRPTSISRGDLRFLRDRRFGLFFFGSVLLWTSTAAVVTYFSIRLIDLGASPPLVGVAWALGAVVEVPLMVAFPRIARRIGAERLIVAAAVAFAIRSAMVALATEPTLVVASAGFSGIGFGLFYVGTVSYVAEHTPPQMRATAQGIFSGTAFSLGNICGAVLAGWLSATLPLPGLFAIAAAGALVAAVIIGFGVGVGRRADPDPA